LGRHKKNLDPPKEEVTGPGQEPQPASPGNESQDPGGEKLTTGEGASASQEGEVVNAELVETAEASPPETCKEYLRRYFTSEEREILANQADQAHGELIQANEEKATFNANIKSRITNLEGEIARLHRLRQAGFEMDHIICVVTRDYDRKMVLIHRSDTGEFVRERRMTLDEQQRSLLPPETKEEVAEHFGVEPSAPPAFETPPPLENTEGFQKDWEPGKSPEAPGGTEPAMTF
jgi:hypothetical protein